MDTPMFLKQQNHLLYREVWVSCALTGLIHLRTHYCWWWLWYSQTLLAWEYDGKAKIQTLRSFNDHISSGCVITRICVTKEAHFYIQYNQISPLRLPYLATEVPNSEKKDVPGIFDFHKSPFLCLTLFQKISYNHLFLYCFYYLH